MLPENKNDTITEQNDTHNYLLKNKSENWKSENVDMLQNAKNTKLSDENPTCDKCIENDCPHLNLLIKPEILTEKQNGILKKDDPSDHTKLIKSNLEHKIVKPCLTDDSCKGLLNASRVLVGPRGEILVREDTVVAGCTSCSGGRLISCARIKCTTNALCWQRSSKKPSKCILGGLIILTLFSFIGSIVFCFSNIFSSTILSNMIIKNNSRAYTLWKNPPVQPYMKVHIFNYTNINEYMSGAETKLKVQDLGPYTYRETVSNVNEEFHPNGTLTFQIKRSYQFVSSESVGTQYDKVVVPNVPLLSAVSMTRDSNFVTKTTLSLATKGLQTTAFKTLPSHRFLWGYEDSLINLVKPYLLLQGKLSYDNFGVLVTKNGTAEDRITINTGENDTNMIGVIDNINGKNKLDVWGTEECNKIDATQGFIFPISVLDRKQTIYAYNNEICRKFPFKYEKDVKVFNDIPALRYSPPKDLFDDPSTNPGNQCYCHIDSGVCPPKGTFNATRCVAGAPVIASLPHFYLGDSSLLEPFEGLEPSEEKHKSYISIHPTLGMPLAASSKTQINMQIVKSPYFPQLDFLPDELILPVIWLEIYVAELPQEVRTLIYHATFSTYQIQLVLMWVSIVTFIISGIFSVMALRAKFSSS